MATPDITRHPDYQRMLREQRQADEQASLDRQLAAAEAIQLRERQGQDYRKRVSELLQEADQQRLAYHAKLGELFNAQMAYQNLTGRECPDFNSMMFNRTDLPSLTRHSADSGFTTTRATVMSFFSNGGKWS